MYILSIETSCDETALSLININREKKSFTLIEDLLISQIPIHAEYGGVFPALAKREHKKNIPILLEGLFTRAIQKIKLSKKIKLTQEKRKKVKKILVREEGLADMILEIFQKEIPPIDALVFTQGPGLAPALWVGVNTAKAIATLIEVPLYPINHMEGHISSILLKEGYQNEKIANYPLENFSFPMIALLISGGHTELILVKNWGDYQIIGETLDDAVGEAFDKVARMLGLDYPGGPKLSLLAEQGRENEKIQLPRPMLHHDDYRFSFSGLKTATRYLIEKLKNEQNFSKAIKADIAKAFEDAVVEVLTKKTEKALKAYHAKGLIVAGGVSANKKLREAFQELTREMQIPLYLPQQMLCGDNSLMIASAGFLHILAGEKGKKYEEEIEAKSNLRLGESL